MTTVSTKIDVQKHSRPEKATLLEFTWKNQFLSKKKKKKSIISSFNGVQTEPLTSILQKDRDFQSY